MSVSHRASPYLWIVLAIAAGCGSSANPAGILCDNPEQTKIWLLGEVDDSFETHSDGTFSFPMTNRTGHPVQVRVRSIGCSCYQVKRDSTRLMVGDEFELGTNSSATLVLHPPRPTSERHADYSFSVEYEPNPGEARKVLSCRGTLHCLSDLRLSPGNWTVDFSKDTPSQAIVGEVTRTARDRESAEVKLQISGWPVGTGVKDPEPVGPCVQNHQGLWQQRWKVVAAVSRPVEQTFAEQYSSIRVSGAMAKSPVCLGRLVVRCRSGLSGPRLVHFGEIPLGSPVKRRIQILAQDDRPFRIVGPTDTQQIVSIQPESVDAQKMQWGNLTFVPAKSGDVREIVEIATDHPEHPTLAVEVRAHVNP